MRTRTVWTYSAAATAVVTLGLALAACGASPHSTARTSGRSRSSPEIPGRSSAATGTSGRPAVLTAGDTAGGTSVSDGTITTEGVGTVSGAPDTMTVSIDVSTSALHAAEALAQNNAVAAAVQQALERDGVAAKDLQMTNLSLQETYPPSRPGFQVDDEVTATLRTLSTAGKAIDDAVAAGGDSGRLNGVAFSVSDSSPLMAVARQQAVAIARTQAEQLAAAAGERLGALVSLTDQPEQTGGGSQEFAAVSAGAASAPVPVQPGTQQLTVAVTGVWAVDPQ